MMRKNKLYVIGFIVVIAILVLTSAFYIVDETEQVVITQFGDPIGEPIKAAGLHIKMPFIQKATFFEERFLEWDGDANQIPTADKKYILVNTYARWRIVDALKFYQSVRTEGNAMSRIDDIIDGITRDFISENLLIEIVRNSNRKLAISEENINIIEPDSLKIEKGRREITRSILEEVKKVVPQYGIDVLDIRIRQINYIENVREKVFDRMISERKRIASLYRSEGQGQRAEIEGQMERELQRITSQAYRTAQEIKGEADAKATRIYANAYSRDPDFYSLWQTLDSYRNTIDSTGSLILSTDSEYLKYLKSASK